MAAAPIVSLVVVPGAVAPLASAERGPAPRRPRTLAAAGSRREAEFTLAHGAGFAVAVLVIMVAEQTFLNAGPLLVRATEGDRGAALAGFAFNVVLIARAPLVALPGDPDVDPAAPHAAWSARPTTSPTRSGAA